MCGGSKCGLVIFATPLRAGFPRRPVQCSVPHQAGVALCSAPTHRERLLPCRRTRLAHVPRIKPFERPGQFARQNLGSSDHYIVVVNEYHSVCAPVVGGFKLPPPPQLQWMAIEVMHDLIPELWLVAAFPYYHASIIHPIYAILETTQTREKTEVQQR